MVANNKSHARRNRRGKVYMMDKDFELESRNLVRSLLWLKSINIEMTMTKINTFFLLLWPKSINTSSLLLLGNPKRCRVWILVQDHHASDDVDKNNHKRREEEKGINTINWACKSFSEKKIIIRGEHVLNSYTIKFFNKEAQTPHKALKNHSLPPYKPLGCLSPFYKVQN